MTNNIKTFQDIEDNFYKQLLSLGVIKEETDYNYKLHNCINDIKKDFVRQTISKYNTLNLTSHPLHSDYSEETKKLNSKDNLEDIENYIKKLFSKFDSEDRIKEIMFNLDVTKLLKPKDKKYFSYWDIKNAYPNVEDFKHIIKSKCEKELLFSAWALGDKYKRRDVIENLKELLDLMFNIKIEIPDLYKSSMLEIQNKINESKEIKIKLYNEWFYISFTDKDKQNKLLSYCLNKAERQVYSS